MTSPSESGPVPGEPSGGAVARAAHPEADGPVVREFVAAAPNRDEDALRHVANIR